MVEKLSELGGLPLTNNPLPKAAKESCHFLSAWLDTGATWGALKPDVYTQIN